MKIVIDISKDRYDEIMAMDWKNCRRFFDEEIRAIHDGKALEQEPCDDTISRQIISDYVQSHILEINTGYGDLNKHTNEILRMIVDYIESMPPVTPQQKMGRWIKHSDNVGNWWECDQCGTDWGGAVNYCPNCGAKMQEVENKNG